MCEMFASLGIKMKRTIKLISLSALAFLSGALILQSVPAIHMAKADDEIIYNVGYARSDTEANLNSNQQYFNIKSNEAPYNSNWAVRYKSKTPEAIRFVRDGVTYNIGRNDQEAIVRLSDTRCELQTWMFSSQTGIDNFSFQDGDKVIFGGSFFHVKDGVTHTINVSETTFLCLTGKEDGVNKSYFVAEPQQITDISGYDITMIDESWHMLFDIKDISLDAAPLSDDSDTSLSYYPLTPESFYVDGVPSARPRIEGLRRRANNWYPVTDDDKQGIEKNLKVGSVLVMDGLFVYHGIIPTNTNYESLALNFHMLTFQKVGPGRNDFAIIDLHDYLIDALHKEYSVDDFVPDDKNAALAALDGFEENIGNKETAGESYAFYNETLETLSSLTIVDSILNGYKQSGIQTINSYVDLDDYFTEQQNTISNYISEYTGFISSAGNINQINNYVKTFKDLVDAVSKKADIMADAIINQTAGYENYLEPCDSVSLSDLGFSEILTFHGDLDERANDLNTNAQDNNLHNTFAPSLDNPNGNVEFRFSYTPNAVPTGGANVCFSLRGISYYGYKFAIDTKTRGCYVQRLDQTTDDFLGGPGDGLFTNGNTYEIAIGAIDLIDEVEKTWIYIKINDHIVFSKVTDSLLICSNARVAITRNDNMTVSYPGTVTVANSTTEIEQTKGFYAGRLIYAQGNTDEIRATLETNELPSNREGLEMSYATRPENVQLIRNNVTTNIGKVDQPLLKKMSDTEYIFDVSKCIKPQDNDIILISGTFSYYSDSDHAKKAFTIFSSRFQYLASSDYWTPVITLVEAKGDAILKLENHVDLDKYDQDEQNTITSIVNTGKFAINDATSIEQVESIYDGYKGQIDKVKTSLRKYQDAAIETINAYKASELNNYREDEIDDIASLKKDAVEEVNNAKSKDAVDEIVVNLKMDIDDLKTDAQYKVIELADAIKDGQQEIYDHYSSIDTSKYSDEKLAQLEQDTKAAITAVKNAKSIEEVNDIVNAYKNAHKASKKGCKSSAVASGSVLLFIAAMGGLFIALRQGKKEEE